LIHFYKRKSEDVPVSLSAVLVRTMAGRLICGW